MRNSGIPENPDPQTERDVFDEINNPGSMYCDVIENAGGVPFKLIFGPKPGEGYYLFIGKGIYGLTGIPSEEFTEKIFLEMIDKVIPLQTGIPDDLSGMRERFIKGELKSYKVETLLKLKNGETKWIQDSSLPLLDEETGRVIGAFGILTDIDDRKRHLTSQEDARVREEESDKLKSIFLHNISHEIRTPLNAIVGFSAFLSNPESYAGDMGQIREIITKSSDHLLEIFDNIIEISTLEAGHVRIKKERVNVDEILRKVYERFRERAFESHITLEYITGQDGDEPELLTDEFKLSQVLVNLVGNSMKFTKEGGVKYGYFRKNDRIEFYVSDTGIGIPKAQHPMIFKSFFQADSSNTRTYEGTGLGLSISKAYVDLLGGEIWFSSDPGVGSVFYFSLPWQND
jgi:signal transduction histidine kinase